MEYYIANILKKKFVRAKIELIFINTSAAAKRRRILERGYGDDKSGKKIDKDGEGRC